MNWSEKLSVKKGDIGEDIVKQVLEDKGYVVYKCVTKKAHAFDFLCVKDKKVFVISEVKSKARLNKFNATGIDQRHFSEYLNIYNTLGIDVILFFVDEHPKEQRIYCQKLSILIQPKTIDGISYPNSKLINNTVIFSLLDMKHVCNLSGEQITQLKSSSSRSYDYE